MQRAADRVGALDLGQQDRVGTGPRHGAEIGVAPGGVEAVDAHDQLAPGIGVALLQRLEDLLAPVALGVGGDRVLEVEDDAVGRQGAALLQGPGIGARHVQHAAAGADGGGHVVVSGHLLRRTLARRFGRGTSRDIVKPG